MMAFPPPATMLLQLLPPLLLLLLLSATCFDSGMRKNTKNKNTKTKRKNAEVCAIPNIFARRMTTL